MHAHPAGVHRHLHAHTAVVDRHLHAHSTVIRHGVARWVLAVVCGKWLSLHHLLRRVVAGLICRNAIMDGLEAIMVIVAVMRCDVSGATVGKAAGPANTAEDAA